MGTKRWLAAFSAGATIAAMGLSGLAAQPAGASVVGARTAPAPTTAPVRPPRPPGTPLGETFIGAPRAHASSTGATGYESKVCDGCSPPLLYGGGPVMSVGSGGLTIYPIYWAPPGSQFDASYVSLIDKYLTDVAADSGKTTNVYSVATEYYQQVNGQQQNISYQVKFGGHIDATDAPDPTRTACTPNDGTSTVCVSDDQMQAEISNVLGAKGLPPGLGSLYMVFLPPSVEAVDSTGNSGGFCGYHSNFTTAAGPVIYSNDPFIFCDSGQSPNANPAADSALDTADHEIVESMTDPLGNAWGDTNGNEIGDECNNIYGTPLGATQATNSNGDGASYNQSMGAGDTFYVQEEYSNTAGACIQHAGQAAPPSNKVTVSLSPTSLPADGRSTSTVTVTVTDPSGAPLANDAVTLVSSPAQSSQLSCGAFSPPSATTNAQGVLTSTYTATTDNVTCNVAATEAGSGAAGQSALTQGNPVAVATFSRVAGADRVATAAAVSQSSFPTAASAKVVVLASDQSYPDALAGGPLAAKLGGPVLITDPSTLSAAAEAEIKRVLPAGGSVMVIGGSTAISDAILARLGADGFMAQRISGANRFATAVAVADVLGDPANVVEASGLTFADALPGGPIAAKIGGVILLTDGSAQAPETAQYLSAHGGGTRVALGGPAAAADPSATPIVGANRYATAAKAAAAYFPSATVAGLASGLAFPDALAGGAAMAAGGAPILLTDPTTLSPDTSGYLNSVQPTLTKIVVFGGESAVSSQVANSAAQAG